MEMSAPRNKNQLIDELRRIYRGATTIGLNNPQEAEIKRDAMALFRALRARASMEARTKTESATIYRIIPGSKSYREEVVRRLSGILAHHGLKLASDTLKESQEQSVGLTVSGWTDTQNPRDDTGATKQAIYRPRSTRKKEEKDDKGTHAGVPVLT